VGWREDERKRHEAVLEELRDIRARIADLTPAVESKELPEPAQRPLARFPGLALAVRLCRDENGDALLRMLRPVPREHREGPHGLRVNCLCGAQLEVRDTLRPCPGDCGRWMVGDPSGVWSVTLPAERFDAPGCQMCGASEGDPCDCHDPQT